MAIHDLRGRVLEKFQDPWGRWTALSLQGKNARKILYVTAYQVCIRPTNITGSTAYHQQEALARLEKRPKQHPRHYFIADLRKFLRSKSSDNYSIILGGDFNESPHHPKSGMRSLIDDCDLIDIWAYRNPGQEFNTRHPGQVRIDYILISPDLVNSVQAVGYFPFHYRSRSDHRGMYIDFQTDLLFGDSTNKLCPRSQRGVDSRDPSSCTAYVQAAGRHCLENSLFNLATRLTSLTVPDHALAEKIDTILGQAMLHGDKQCVPRRRYWWSYKLHQERLWKSILKRLESSFRSNLDIQDTLRSLMNQYHLHSRDLPSTLPECRREIRLVSREIQRLKQKSLDVRLEEKISVAQIYDDTGEKDRAQLIREISHAEQRADTFRLFDHIRSKDQQSSLTHLEIPDTWPESTSPIEATADLPDPKHHATLPHAKWRRITQPAELEYYLSLRNRRHFGQAQGTPFTVPPLSYDIDWGASTLTAEAILSGDDLSYNLPDSLHAILTACQRQLAVPSVTGHVTLSEFRDKFKIWNESTTTSPSGRHLGLYKALFSRHSLTDPAERKRFESLRTSLISVHLALINYCLKFRYSLNRWTEVVNVMILKDPGDFRIHRLRVIHIYEADFNFLLGLKWRQLLHHADSVDALHRGQYGGRPGREACTLTFMEELKTDISYSSRKPLVNFDNDAAACYDRIIPSLASLVARSFGQDQNVCFVHAATLAAAKFRLKTALGVSDTFYQHCSAYPIFGTGQGSANSPVIWVFISSILFRCHEKQAFGAIFESPDRSVRITFSMVGFVDDSTGQVNDFLSESVPSMHRLVRMMSHDAQLWNDLLSHSGGLLEISKCSYHILYFAFRANGIPHMVPGHNGPELTIYDQHSDQHILVPQKLNFQSHKTLGHYKAPSGNQSKQLQTIRDKGILLARQLFTSPATRIQALIFYWSIYIPSIRYCLPQSFFSPRVLHDAQAKSFPLILAKCGYMRTTAHPIVFGPVPLGGAGFIRWPTLQGEGQIQLFVKQWRAGDDAGQLLRIALSWAQFQAGTGRPLLQDVHARLPYLESRWIPSLRAFLATIDATIVTDRTYVIPLQRVHDKYIMDTFITMDALSDTELHVLNCCRLFLNVVTLSDLVDADGIHMNAHIRRHMPSNSSWSTYHPPVQERPSSWTLWDNLLKIWFHPSGRLLTPLGAWLAPAPRLRRTWSFYFDPATTQVYQKTVDGYVRYSRDTSGFTLQEVTSWTPTFTSTPIRPHYLGSHTIALDHPLQPFQSPPVAPPSDTFSDFVMTLPQWEQPLLQNIQFVIPPYTFQSILEQHTPSPQDADSIESSSSKISTLPSSLSADSSVCELRFVSDGSQISDSMSFGWSFSFPNGDRIATCAGPGYGPGTSHCAEGYGVLSAVRFVIRLREFLFDRSSWSIRFASDNQGLITRINQRHTYSLPYANSTLHPDWDIVEQIHATLQSQPIKCVFRHVKGHQDQQTQYEDLTLDAQLNVDADHLAGTYFHEFPSTQPIAPLLPTTGAHLQIASRTITSHYVRHIRHAVAYKEYRDYICSKRHWSQEIWETIDQVALRRAIARHSDKGVNIVKLIHDLLPTSAIRHYTDSTIPQHCERCFTEMSRFSHLIRCPHPVNEQWRTELISQIRAECERHTTRLSISTAIIAGLSSWFAGKLAPTTDFPPDVAHALAEQHELGWLPFLHGMWTSRWAKLQHCHYVHNDLHSVSRSGDTWSVALITVIWKHLFALWEAYTHLVHGEDHKSRRKIARDRAITKIRTLHQHATNLRADDQCWLVPNLEEFLHSSTLSTLQRWLVTYEPILLDAIRLTKLESVANTRSLRTFFPTIRAPNNPLSRAARPHPNIPLVTDAPAPAKQRPSPPHPTSPLPSVRQYFPLTLS